MGEETFVLIMLVIVMLVGSYMAGSIPLVMRLSEKKLKFVTLLGAGLLVGTALTVIIPEGIRSLYMDGTAMTKSHVQTAEVLPSMTSNSNNVVAEMHVGHEHAEPEDHTRAIGLSLVLGFVFMMLVDQISTQKSADTEKNITATIGLVVHAAADGVALGAAATTSHQDVEIIVFLAIMLHKAPAAFGLVSFLLHERIERQQIRKHLAVFSLSAPLLTLITYFGIGQEQKETLNSVNATGIAMLFSAGTFLYVATVHVLPELTHGSHGGGGGASSGGSHHEYRPLAANPDGEVSIESGKTSAIVTPHQKGLKWSELITMVCGALLPLILTMGHHH